MSPALELEEPLGQTAERSGSHRDAPLRRGLAHDCWHVAQQ